MSPQKGGGQKLKIVLLGQVKKKEERQHKNIF